MEIFNLKTLKEVECKKERYELKISKRFTALENIDDDVYINRACESIRINIKFPTIESLGY
jgi:hypothetical protein